MTPTGTASHGVSIATAVANAAADAECPDGNDGVTGTRRTRRDSGMSADGRARRKMTLTGPLARELATPTAVMPRSAARRRRPPLAPRPAATAHHRTPWSAARD